MFFLFFLKGVERDWEVFSPPWNLGVEKREQKKIDNPISPPGFEKLMKALQGIFPTHNENTSIHRHGFDVVDSSTSLLKCYLQQKHFGTVVKDDPIVRGYQIFLFFGTNHMLWKVELISLLEHLKVQSKSIEAKWFFFIKHYLIKM